MYINNPEVQRIAKIAFPDYSGKKFIVKPCDYPINVRSYWDGGTRDYFAFVELSTGKTIPIPSQHPLYDKPIEGTDKVNLPQGIVCVKNTCFCGKWMPITIYVRPENITPNLTSGEESKLTEELSREEKVMLHLFCGLKSFARKEASYRHGIKAENYEQLKQGLIQKGLLSNIGGVTDRGRNLREGFKAEFSSLIY